MTPISLINKPIYKVFVEKTNKKGFKSLNNKLSLFSLFGQEKSGLIKAFSIKLYKKGYRTHEIAQALGVSTRTIWKAIKKYRNDQKLGRHHWIRRTPKYWRLKSVKIKRIQHIQKLFYNLLDWLQNSQILDLDAIVRGDPV